MPPVRALIYEGLTDTQFTGSTVARYGGGPLTNTLTSKPIRQDEISFTRARMGGDMTAFIRGTIPIRSIDAWMTHLGCLVQIISASGVILWNGLIETITITHDGFEQSITRNGMINSLRVRYSENGASVTSGAAEVTASLHLHGPFMAILDVGEMIQSAAESQRDAMVNARAWPVRQARSVLRSTRQMTSGTAEIAIECAGWWQQMGRIVYNAFATSGTISAGGAMMTGTMMTLCFGYSPTDYGVGGIGITQPFVSQQYSGSAPNAPTGKSGGLPVDVPATNGYETVLQVMDRYLALGTDVGPFTWQFHPNHYNEGAFSRTAILGYWNEWAATDPATIDYYLNPPNQIVTAQNVPVPLWWVRPDMMASFLPVAARPVASVVSTAASFYIERTTYTWRRDAGEQVEIEPYAPGSGSDALRLFQ